MKYISTRGQTLPLPFKETVMAGLASDGGLFVPSELPHVFPLLDGWKELPFTDLFFEVVKLFIGDDIPSDKLREMIRRSYTHFDHPEITPVVKVGQLYLVELFHGPTLAFKDIALQFLGNLFEYFLAQSGSRLTVIGATSGDTGSAAIHALKGKEGIEVFILFPEGRVSPVQERQMTTVLDSNIHPLAIGGSFDDAQDIIKGMFGDKDFNRKYNLGAINSINWARVMAQIVYYFFAYFHVIRAENLRLGDPVRFAIPTGNFGHIYAGHLAREMGLPIEKLILATNANSILAGFVQSGTYRKGQVINTFSPSMDIQLASNFERYLFDLAGRDSDQVKLWLDELQSKGEFSVGEGLFNRVGEEFLSASVDDRTTLETISKIYREEDYLLDPHSAVGFRAALDNNSAGIPVICMATAHAAKFSEAIQKAIGKEPPLPPSLKGLHDLPVKSDTLPARLEDFQNFIRNTLG